MPEPFLNKVAGFRPQNFAKFFRQFFIEHLQWLLLTVKSFICLFHTSCMLSKQMKKQMLFRAGRNFQIFRAQIVLLIMLPFLNDKTDASQGNIRKSRFPVSLKLLSRRETSIKAGNILSFLGSSVVLRTL